MGSEWGVSTQPTGEQSGQKLAPRHKGEFPSKSEGGSEGQGRDFQIGKKGMSKGVRSMRFHVYIVLIKDCV
jgi:hypothetical protein